MSDESFDVVIVGAGTAGCVLANRLSADPARRVLLLEAGPPDTNPWLKIPAGVPRVVTHPRLTWGYASDPEPGLDGRRLQWPRGRTLGGSSSINGHVYMRGTPADYDRWRDLGLPDWGWHDVLPYFKRGEAHVDGESDLHGGSGELTVSRLVDPHPASRAFVEAAVNLGLARNDDFNGPTQEGVGYLHFMIREGVRASCARAFLHPVRHRPNLVLRTGAFVERVRIEAGRARGVELRIDGQPRFIQAGEVISCGGAINSPQLLMLSGIGPGQALSELGIPVHHDLPGVGENLHDHLYAHCLIAVDPTFSINRRIASPIRMLPDVLRYLFTRRGLLTTAAAQVGVFARTRPELAHPDLQVQMRPFSMISRQGMYTADPAPFITASCALLQPRSRGQVRLRSADPREAPSMAANYLTDPRDIAPLRAGLRLIRAIAATAPFAGHARGEALPGPGHDSDEALTAYLRANAQSMYHPVGTCRMGPDHDPHAVVDARLRVRGVAGLRVVDASVMPLIPSGNTNAPTIMIAEKAADLIRDDARAARH